MNTFYYYKKGRVVNPRIFLRSLSVAIFLLGLSITIYVFSPLVLWQIYFAPAFASQQITAPIPKTSVLNASLMNLLSQAAKVHGVDYTNAQNWFPGFKSNSWKNQPVPTYSLTIPKLHIKNAVVSTRDFDVGSHLINYIGTSVPPNTGNAVIFGHSTLPQLFDPNNYKTIFANAYQLTVGDDVLVNISGVTYKYAIFNITVVDPTDTSVLAQSFNDSYLTLITCTPPGTVWKRLVIRARLEKI